MMERSRDRPATGGLRKAVRCLIPPDPELTTVKNGGKAPATASATCDGDCSCSFDGDCRKRTLLSSSGQFLVVGKAAGNESAAARIPGALFRQLGEWTEPSPATRDVCRKDDVDGYVDTTGGDVAAECLRLAWNTMLTSALVGLTSSLLLGLTSSLMLTSARADIIAAARADIIADTGASRADVSNYTIKARADIIDDTRKARADINTDTCKNRADVSNSVERNQAMHDAPLPTGLYVGNIPLHAYPDTIIDDKIAHAFNHSTRKTLSFIAPTMQNGEVVVRPSLDAVRNGSKRWKSTAVGYFLGKRPYYHHLKEFAHSVWPALREVTATTNGFFFFQFKTVFDMEEIIEGGPWLFQGQPIVLQKWEPGMAMRKLKHTQVPVWIKLRHLPMEFWTTEGLSTVASGVGKPLYPRRDYKSMHETGLCSCMCDD
ncbi:UNVERIFIED_CONTAM: hypothetical protein Sindi_3091900 [Sesamum indicum]